MVIISGRFDRLVRSRQILCIVIPAEAGIQIGQEILDPGASPPTRGG